ncbi:precorrin-6A synthase (deacetylating) [Longispora urticae]
MKKILVIGIGAGDPDHLTFQAAKAIGRTDVFFVLDKGEDKHDLVRLREQLLAAHAQGSHRVVEAGDPARDRTTPAYAEAVRDWRSRRADLFERLIAEELADGQTGAFLVWGDPGLYDSTLAALDDILTRDRTALDYTVIPGITCVAALTAAHGIALNRIGRPVQITPGRRLAADGVPDGIDDLVVMLDAGCAFAELPDAADFDIYWGAYLGTADEILVHGPVVEVADRIRELRAVARATKGWIMDTYLLRRTTLS